MSEPCRHCDCELRGRQWNGFGKCLSCGRLYGLTKHESDAAVDAIGRASELLETSAALTTERDQLRAEVAAVSAARDEACNIVIAIMDPDDEEYWRAKQLRAVGRTKETP